MTLSFLWCVSARRQSGSVASRTLSGTLRVVDWDLGAAVGATHFHPDHAVPQPQQSRQDDRQLCSRWKAHLFTRGAAQQHRLKPFRSEPQQWQRSGLMTPSTLYMCMLDLLAGTEELKRKMVSRLYVWFVFFKTFWALGSSECTELIRTPEEQRRTVDSYCCFWGKWWTGVLKSIGLDFGLWFIIYRYFLSEKQKLNFTPTIQ